MLSLSMDMSGDVGYLYAGAIFMDIKTKIKDIEWHIIFWIFFYLSLVCFQF
jgi:hypothetical protein